MKLCAFCNLVQTVVAGFWKASRYMTGRSWFGPVSPDIAPVGISASRVVMERNEKNCLV